MKVTTKYILILTLIISMINSACSSKKNSPVFNISTEDGTELFRVDERGNVFANSEKVALLKDGLLINLANDTIAILKQDHIVYDKSNKPITKILNDGTIDMGANKTLRWSNDGTFAIHSNQTISIKPNNKALYRQASLLFIAYATLENSDSSIEITTDSTEIINDTTNANTNTENNMETDNSTNSLNITKISTAYIKSGSLNGSLPNNIRADVYNYTSFDVIKNAKQQTAFNNVFETFLDETKVNNLISLRAYLQLVKDNKTTELLKVHNALPTRPIGNAISNLPILLFAENGSLPKYKIPLFDVDLTGIGVSKMYQFLKTNGKHFSSEIPDEFFQTYYLNTQLNTEQPRKITENNKKDNSKLND